MARTDENNKSKGIWGGKYLVGVLLLILIELYGSYLSPFHRNKDHYLRNTVSLIGKPPGAVNYTALPETYRNQFRGGGFTRLSDRENYIFSAITPQEVVTYFDQILLSEGWRILGERHQPLKHGRLYWCGNADKGGEYVIATLTIDHLEIEPRYRSLELGKWSAGFSVNWHAPPRFWAISNGGDCGRID